MSREKQVEIKVVTYKEERLNYFTALYEKAKKKFDRLFEKHKDAPYLSDEFQKMSDAGRGAEFLGDVVKMLKQSEWISVEERLPEDVYGRDRKQITVLVCTKSGRVSTSSRVRMMQISRDTWEFEYTDIFEWSGQIAKKVTHWMPLPEAPKGGAE